MSQEISRFSPWFAAIASALVLAGCGGGGGSGGTTPPGSGNPPPGNGGTTITVSGRITFDRLPYQTTLGNGLNPSAPVISPAREVVVEAVTGSNVVSTTTDSNGNYSLSVPASSTSLIRVRAQMLKQGTAPTWNFIVKNNTNSDAVYVLQGDSFATGTANITRDLHAPSGWTGTTYNDAQRSAAPFAILDTIYRTKQLILSAQPAAVFPALDLFWSTKNRDVTNSLCPDTGDLGTSFYFSDPNNNVNDECSQPAPLPTGIYILGEYRGSNNGDTDEFDAHVIAHEFGHYFEDRFSRSDSIGQDHGIGDKLDLRVAFGEGWGNAFSGMSLGDPQYRDSRDGISSDFGFNIENDSNVNEGWFSEASVAEILWDIFDTTAEPGDNVTLGFAPIYAVMNDEQVSTDAFTSIFSFASALRADNSAQSSAVRDLLQGEQISGTNAFGSGESNGSNDAGFTDVYTDITLGSPVTGLCSTTNAGGKVGGNKLGNRRFLRFVKSAPGTVTIRADGVASGSVPGSGAAVDPDIFVYQRGAPVGSGTSTDDRLELISGLQLAAGTHVIEVYAFEVINEDPDQGPVVSTPRCLNLSISGT